MKKITFVSINTRFTHLNLASLYFKEVIKPLPYKFNSLEFDINQDILNILQNIYLSEPDIIAMSVYIWNSNIIKSILPLIKKVLPNSKIILGGPEVSFNSLDWINKFFEIDFIIQGKGERGFYYLLENINEIKTKIINKKNYSFNDIPFPYQDNKFKKLLNKYIYYETSRGCPYKCSYCISSLKDQYLEIRNTKKVLKELEFLISKNPKIIKFVDRTFNVKKSHYQKIWQYLLKINTDTKFHFEIYPELIDDSDLKILKSVPNNRFQFELGIQSMNVKSLKAVNRIDNTDLTIKNIKHLIALKNIHIHIGLIAGLPYETLNKFKKTFNISYLLKPHNLQLGFLKVLPGTKISNDINKFDIKCLDYANYHVINTKWLSFEDIIKLKKIEIFLILIHNSEKFKYTEKYILKNFKNPFEFYEKIVEFADLKYEIGHKDWAKTANIILGFIKYIKIKDRNLIYDALRLDWCYISKSNYYPDQLQYKENVNLKIKFQLKDKLKNNYRDFDNLTNSDINKSIVYISLSKLFQKKEKIKKLSLFFQNKKFLLGCD